jgi:type VI secretion system protein ImpK
LILQSVPASESSFIVNSFENFYREVLIMKDKILTKEWMKPDPQGNEITPDLAADFILKHLQNALEKQMIEASYGSTEFAQTYYTEAQYVMVALADEVFLNIKWPGHKYWESNILEKRMYNTHSAGQGFFTRLEKLLQDQDPVRHDIGIVFLFALGLGFRGKYRGSDDKGVIQGLKERLFTFINRREPYLYTGEDVIFPEAYLHTVEGANPQILPNARNWMMIFAGIGFTYLLLSYIIWFSNTWTVSEAAKNILIHTGMGG